MNIEQTARKAAEAILDDLDDSVRIPIEGTGLFHINSDKVDLLTDILQSTIANVVASIIDAGSERDAVNENDELHDAIVAELLGWSEKAPS